VELPHPVLSSCLLFCSVFCHRDMQCIPTVARCPFVEVHCLCRLSNFHVRNVQVSLSHVNLRISWVQRFTKISQYRNLD
jgi:phosphopantetheinyl transferase (holo-ACP synthase)